MTAPGTLPLHYDVPRLLDEYESLRAMLWRIAQRAQTAQTKKDREALASIEADAMEALAGVPRPASL